MNYSPHPNSPRGYWIVLLFVALAVTVGPSVVESARAKPPDVVIGTLTTSTDDTSTQARSKVLSSGISDDLSNTGQVNLLDRRHYANLMEERESSPFQQKKDLASRLAGADYLISGSLIKLRDEWMVTLQVIHVEAGSIVDTISTRSPELVKTSEPLVEKLLTVIEKTGLEQPRTDQKELTYKPQIRLLYLRGLRYFHLGKYYRSLSQFMRARDLGFEKPVLNFWMGRAYYQLDKPNHARMELKSFVNNAFEHPYRTYSQELLENL